MLLQLEMLQPMWKPTFEARSLKRLGDELERPRKRQSRQNFITEEEVNYQLKQAVESIVSVIELPSPAATPLTRSFQKALLVVGKGKYELCNHYQMPVLQNDHEVMIRTQAVGLNPIDWKSVAYNFCLPQFPWVTGRELAGVVEKVGKSVTHLRPGDRVWTSTYYRDVRAGCFQEYVVVPEHTALPIPGGLSYEEAACLGVAALTACITLWRWLQVPQPRPTTAKHFSSSYRDLGKQPCDEEGWFLIWGGSSITGQFAVQLAKLSGLKVVVVCSTQSVGLCQSLGADGVVTRDNKEVAEIMAELTDITRGCITRALDLVGPETASYCLQVCSATQQREQLGQKKVLFAPLAMMRSSEPVPNTVEVLTVEMKQFVLNASFRRYAQTLNEFLETGQLRLPSLSILDGGLEAVETGLELVKSGKMNGTRVIVRVP